MKPSSVVLLLGGLSILAFAAACQTAISTEVGPTHPAAATSSPIPATVTATLNAADSRAARQTVQAGNRIALALTRAAGTTTALSAQRAEETAATFNPDWAMQTRAAFSTQLAVHPPPSSTHDPCILWSEVTPAMQGQIICIVGIVKKTQIGQFGTRFLFSDDPSDFYARTMYFLLIDKYIKETGGICFNARGELHVSASGVPYLDLDKLTASASKQIRAFESNKPCQARNLH